MSPTLSSFRLLLIRLVLLALLIGSGVPMPSAQQGSARVHNPHGPPQTHGTGFSYDIIRANGAIG
uniref:Uncharacterized protein n=3 Tax=Oryza sativa subsp. japonica TaxID=39947 RepID=Q5VPA6_ORYSJ|nr:hypothetical protein [Oryza sativa Japonica Group]BAD68719.1 hypothetical protein [Oryza sativa Japonica Group]